MAAGLPHTVEAWPRACRKYHTWALPRPKQGALKEPLALSAKPGRCTRQRAVLAGCADCSHWLVYISDRFSETEN